MNTSSNPEAVISPAQVRAVCLLYRAATDAGREHDDAAQFAADINPARLVTIDGQVDIEKIAKTADRFTPPRLDMSATVQGDRYMTAIALVEGMVNEDNATNALLPPVSPNILALLGAQTAVTKMVLDNWCKGREREILDDLRRHVLAHLIGEDTK